jgi:hypothetical protein
MIDLIPISYLNEACFLSLNTDDKKFRMCLKIAQEDLRDLLSKTFYEQIETQYNSDPTTFSANNNTLYEDYIKNYLAWHTYYNYLKFANSDPTPTGIREFNDENSSVISDVKMYSLEKNILARANTYKFRMLNYIKLKKTENADNFPLFTDTCKPQFSFGITSVEKCDSTLISVNKSIHTNE